MSAISYEKHLPRLFLAQLDQFDATQPFMRRLPAAVLMTDISGFSALAMDLTRDGAQGVEILRQVLDDYFGSLGAIVERHGGDIATFAGDAVIALWQAGDGMPAALRLAAACALAIQHEAPGWPSAQRLKLSQRVAIGCGEMIIAKLGGTQGKWLNLFAGQPVVDAGRACDVTTPGEVLLTHDAALQLHDAQTSATGHVDGYSRLDALSGTGAPPLVLPVPALTPERLEPYIPEVLVRRAKSGHDEWLEEFRVVTVMFAKLENIDFASADGPGQLQAMTFAIQQAVHRFGGAMPYVQMDDKGLNFIIAFGIPTATHEDDAARALGAGLEIQGALRAIGMRPSIGVATGILYCGECGATHRRQYSMIGPAINFAARLAGAAPDDLLCDEETAKATRDKLGFTVAHNVRPKHADATVLALRPEWRTRVAASERVGALAGRGVELQHLADSLQRARGGGGVRLLVSGEPGIGKSRLLRELRSQAEALGYGVLECAAQSLQQSTPYFIWRELLGASLARLGQPGEAPADTLRRQLQDEPQLLPRAALLNDILPLRLVETGLTREIRGTARAASIQALLLHLLQRACAMGPTLLLVDDLHWADALSGQALLVLVERLPALSMIAGTRQQFDEAGSVVADVARLAGLQTLALGALQVQQTQQVVANVYGLATVPDELARLIHGRSGGNPFYTEQLALELRESGHVEIVGGRCKLREDIAARVDKALPDNLRGVITSRVDRLADDQELALKVACVFGRVFSEEGLSAAHPLEPPRERIGKVLRDLLASQLIYRDGADSAAHYVFTHVIVQEAIYELLPMALRKRLHRRIADWLEARHADAMAGFYGVLASHCLLAEEFARALDHLEGGAETALHHSAYREAILHVHKAQRIAAERALAPDAMRQAHWFSLLGDSHHELSEFKQAREQYLNVLALLGQPYAPSASARLLGIVAELLRQLAFRKMPQRAPSSDASAAPSLRLASHAYFRLSEIYYHENDPLAVLHLTLLSVNRAERAAAMAELSAGFGALAIGFGQAGLAGVARGYVQRSIDLAEARPADLNGVAYAHLLAIVYASSQCHWEILDRSGARAQALYAQLGEPFRLAAVRGTRVVGALQRGRFDEADAIIQDMERAAGPETPPRVLGWHLCPQLQRGIVRGRIDRAVVLAAERSAAGVDSMVDRLMSLGAAASAWLHLGETDRALAVALQGQTLLLGQTPVAGAGFVYGPLGVVEVLLACHDRVDPVQVARACAKLKIYTQQVPSTRPRGWFLLGCHAESKGSRRKAMALWRKAAAAAQALSMPYDQAIARLALGQRLPAGNRELEQGTQAFVALGVPAPALFAPGGALQASRAAP